MFHYTVGITFPFHGLLTEPHLLLRIYHLLILGCPNLCSILLVSIVPLFLGIIHTLHLLRGHVFHLLCTLLCILINLAVLEDTDLYHERDRMVTLPLHLRGLCYMQNKHEEGLHPILLQGLLPGFW